MSESIEDFKTRNLKHALDEDKRPKTEEDKTNVIDDDHTLMYQLVGFCESEHYGFENIMCSISFAKKTNSYACSYRFMYPDKHKSWYSLKSKTGSNWIKAKDFNLDQTKAMFKDMIQHLQKINGHEIKVREIEFTGKETTDEVMEILQRSNLVNIAKVDVKKKTIEVLNEDSFDQLDL